MFRYLLAAGLLLFFHLSAAGFLSVEEIRQFYEQGYLIKRGCIPHVQELDLHCSRLLERIFDVLEPMPKSEEQQICYLDGSQLVFKKQQGSCSILRVVGAGGVKPEFLSTLRSETMLHTFFDLLGCDAIEQIICQFHPKLPHDEVKFDRHCDMQFRKGFDPMWSDLNGRGSYAICILAIDPISEENGGLVIDRASYPAPSGEEDPITPILNPGDLLFMHPEIVHWSGPNRSNASRRTLLTGFCIYGANHCAYPGAHVNDCFSRSAEQIVEAPAPWKGTYASGRAGNH